MAKSGKSPYGRYGVYGSLAYDFKAIGNERAGDYSKAEKPKGKRRPRRKALSSPALAVAAVLCAVMLFAGLMSQSALVALSDETVAVQNEINELLERQTELKIRHENAFSLADTERYAIDVLGMQKPSAEQICYIDISEADAQAKEDSDNGSMLDFLSMLSEYFPG